MSTVGVYSMSCFDYLEQWSRAAGWQAPSCRACKVPEGHEYLKAPLPLAGTPEKRHIRDTEGKGLGPCWFRVTAFCSSLHFCLWLMFYNHANDVLQVGKWIKFWKKNKMSLLDFNFWWVILVKIQRIKLEWRTQQFVILENIYHYCSSFEEQIITLNLHFKNTNNA